VTYDTFIDELLTYLPELRAYDEGTLNCLDADPPLPHVVLGSLLLPFLEIALNTGDLKHTLKTCAFLEEASVSAKRDRALHKLISTEVSDWLSYTPEERKVAPWLGTETKRICQYVPGLAAQRMQLKEEHVQNSFGSRLRSIWESLRKSRAKWGPERPLQANRPFFDMMIQIDPSNSSAQQRTK
jgi:hypothetical protein